MIAGYVRLSKDDDKRNYSSIENQKLIIQQYAAEQNLVIDRWYEDDGISGYLFDRPGFNQLIADLEKDIDTVLVKDFSRLGRHNAKILLLLEHFKEQGRRLIVIDDRYDSEISEDDMIGITTWFNERYVKDTSKKIRHAINAKQKAGTLVTRPPFGYQRIDKNKEKIEVIPSEAETIRLIFDLYIQGLGYRKISDYLTQQKIPTPSMAHRKHELEAGQNTRHAISIKWSDGMVKDIISNDFYVGTFRLRKRARKCVHGKDIRVPKEKQYVFENHHPPIIDPMTFSLVQSLKENRTKSGYKGSREKWSPTKSLDPFGSCLFCKDCGSKLTQIKRKTSSSERRYYICSTYNSKGKNYCSKSHLINEQDLLNDFIYYLQICRNTFCQKISSSNKGDFNIHLNSAAEQISAIQTEIAETKKKLQILLTQKINDISINPDKESLIKECYDSIQTDLTTHIYTLENKLSKLSNAIEESASKITTGKPPQTSLEILDQIIQKRNLNRKDIEILVEHIYVDENGFPEITLKYELPHQAFTDK